MKPSPTLIMPAAGAGSRFKRFEKVYPKPLIEIMGVPMAIWAWRSAARYWPNCHTVFLVLREHEEAFQISEIFSKYVKNPAFVFIDSLTGGSAETALAAKSKVDELALGNCPAILLDCDLVFRSSEFAEQINEMTNPGGREGALLTFQSSSERYSYAEVDGDRVTRTAEKQVISPHAIAGAYSFARASTFFRLASQMVCDGTRVGNGEFYTSAVINMMIDEGSTVGFADVDEYWSMGTPEELSACLACDEFRAALGSLSTIG